METPRRRRLYRAKDWRPPSRAADELGEDETDRGGIRKASTPHYGTYQNGPILESSPRSGGYDKFDDTAGSENNYASSDADSDDSLADFIVSDDASEAELRRGSPRRRPQRAPAKQQRALAESDDTNSETPLGTCSSRQQRRQHRDGLNKKVLQELELNAVTLRPSGHENPMGENSGLEAELDLSKGLKKLGLESVPSVSKDISPGTGTEDKRCEPMTNPTDSNENQPPIRTGCQVTRRSLLTEDVPEPDHRDEVSASDADDNSASDNPAGLSDILRRDQSSSIPPIAPPSSDRQPRAHRRTSPAPQASSRAARRRFLACRDDIARTWLAALDSTVTHGRIGALTAATGGVTVQWSVQLRTTAGSASSRRARPADLAVPAPPGEHWVCRIVLSDKVVTDEHRLHDTLAHEFCHLATRLLDNDRRPHGPAFFAWGHRVLAAFPEHGLSNTRCHRLTVAFRFAWRCVDCSTAYQRHSRSIDPARHRCGRCRGVLEQTRPAPSTKPRPPPSAWERFRRSEWAAARAHIAAAGGGGSSTTATAIMAEVAQRWRQTQADATAAGEGAADGGSSDPDASGDGADELGFGDDESVVGADGVEVGDVEDVHGDAIAAAV